MSLIFFDKKKAGAAVAGRSRDGKVETASDEFKLLAADIKSAVSSGSDEDLARALKAFFYLCDSKPRDEGSHE